MIGRGLEPPAPEALAEEPPAPEALAEEPKVDEVNAPKGAENNQPRDVRLLTLTSTFGKALFRTAMINKKKAES